MNAGAGSGVLTFLFTDIEGSTRRWEADADAMRTALTAHDDALRAAVETHGGRVFKHTGDGICAVFSSPKAAVDAAVSAQRALELPVRMGIAIGEAEVREGDYFGAVLNRAARLMSAGHGGQILVDGHTAGMVSGVELIELGPRRLRDIARPVEVFQVQAPGLRTEFPPLKTVDRSLGNLRTPANSFVGREPELTELQSAVDAHRLVTLIGVGGVGKTRLALEVAARSATSFADGVFVIELASLADPGAVPDAVAAVLGITQQPGISMTQSIAQALEGRSRLLVFDNCEHLLDAAAEIIEAIIAASTTVKILATSREGLRLDDEQLWPVPSLDVRAGVDSAAVTLFVERAQGVAPHFSVDRTDDAGDVVDICRRLDGIPLAIELAASRMQSMTVTEVRDRLGDRFRLLTGSGRGLERHQTLRHAVQWSYDLLHNDEKALLAKCSVFAGGFDLTSACAVVGSEDEYATLNLLDSLVRKSLLMANRSYGHTRFTMLETIRQFAEEQLLGMGDAEVARTAHAHYFADRECEIFALWDGPRQREAYSWLTAELPNLRAAFRWVADRGDLDAAATIAHYAAFVGFWGDQPEPIRWAEELIEPARAAQHRRLAQLYGAAQLCFTAGRIDDAVGYAAAGQEAIMSGRFDAVREDVEASIGSSFAAVGQTERWVEWCRWLVARRPAAHVHARAVLALSLKMAAADDEAVAASEGLLVAAEETDNPNLAAWALFAFGIAHRDVAPAAAYEALRRGLAIAQDSGSRMTWAANAGTLSTLATTHGEPADALDSLILLITYYHDSGNFYLLRSPLAVLTILFDRLGHHHVAATLSGFAAVPFNRASLPELDTSISHLRNVLGDQTYESLAGTGEHMTNTEMVKYALDEIDRVRAEI